MYACVGDISTVMMRCPHRPGERPKSCSDPAHAERLVAPGSYQVGVNRPLSSGYVGVVLIAEELLLLALDPVKGTVHLATRSDLHRAVALALAAELAIGGRLSYEDKKLDVVPGEPPADPLLAEALAAISAQLEQGRKPKRVLGSLDKDLGGVWTRLIDRLVTGGTIVEEHHGVLPARHPVADRALHAEVLSRVQAAAAADGPLDSRDAVLLAYGLLCTLVDRVAPERSHRRHTIARMEEAVKVAPFAGILRAMTETQFVPAV